MSFVRRVAIVAVATVVVSVTVVVQSTAAAEPSGDLLHRAPSDAPVIDHFRPPPQPWSPGNRGIDYGTVAGDEVRASAPGRVIFAGAVGGELHITIEHSDGLRTSYSFLADLRVAAGDRVRAGDVVGTAAGPFHFGVRAPDDTYLDPEELLAGRLRASVLLVPGTDQGLDALGSERDSLWSTLLDDGPAAIAAVARAAFDSATLLADYAHELDPMVHIARTGAAIVAWVAGRDDCTDATMPAVAPVERRIVVVVSGLGTASGSNSAWEFDTASLGYDDADVVRFSYTGGRAPGSGASMTSIAARPFDSVDSQQPIGVSADRFDVLMQRVAEANPGVPIDVLAHSQGGIVARLGIERAAASDRLPDEVENLITVGSPHQGAPLAGGVMALAASNGGAASLGAVRDSGAAGTLDDRNPAFADLAPGSAIQVELHDRPIPGSVRFTTIGAAGDVVVPGTSALDPAAHTSVLLPSAVGTEAHGDLPSRPETTREIALAVAGRGPTCRSLASTVGSVALAGTVRWSEAVIGVGAGLGGLVTTGPR